eukprot:13495846-Alexandrium_andersonii.AAC.1
MSASLVGSEMCIRDRARPLRSWCPPRRPPGPSPGYAGRIWGRGGSMCACLLYTSDAADDM